jgi:hypothetical protein
MSLMKSTAMFSQRKNLAENSSVKNGTAVTLTLLLIRSLNVALPYLNCNAATNSLRVVMLIRLVTSRRSCRPIRLVSIQGKRFGS